jgi:hypothetical protein
MIRGYDMFEKKKSDSIVNKIFCVFLDIDGVLNNESSWCRPYTFDMYNLKIFGCFLNVLKNDVKKKVHIVLTSSWKNSINDKKLFAPLIRVLNKYDIVLSEKTLERMNNSERQEEISDYIKRHFEISEYIILDDDEKLFSNPSDRHIYMTDYKTGLVTRDVNGIIKRVRKKAYTID